MRHIRLTKKRPALIPLVVVLAAAAFCRADGINGPINPQTTHVVAANKVPPTAAKKTWFNKKRMPLFVCFVIVSGGILAFIGLAKGGRKMYVRRIAGLDAAEEAVGRATEMGRAVLYIPGIQDINDMATVAGINVLSRIARLAAEHGAELEVPTSRSLVMTACRETVYAAYLSAGRPQAFRADAIHYISNEQFVFVAATVGWMVRERPAACFYMGTFYAESLLLAETGNALGAIQIAGTAEPSQLPFFVAAADYTLIGEELFAASAYLSGEPVQLGSLKGQDMGKLAAIIVIAVGSALAALGGLQGSASGAGRAAQWLTSVLM